jgi:hypothetical protein
MMMMYVRSNVMQYSVNGIDDSIDDDVCVWYVTPVVCMYVEGGCNTASMHCGQDVMSTRPCAW